MPFKREGALYENPWKFKIGDLVNAKSTTGVVVKRDRRGHYVEDRGLRYVEEDWYRVSGRDGLTWHLESELSQLACSAVAGMV